MGVEIRAISGSGSTSVAPPSMSLTEPSAVTRPKPELKHNPHLGLFISPISSLSSSCRCLSGPVSYVPQGWATRPGLTLALTLALALAPAVYHLSSQVCRECRASRNPLAALLQLLKSPLAASWRSPHGPPPTALPPQASPHSPLPHGPPT